jgi:hypothetical protein
LVKIELTQPRDLAVVDNKLHITSSHPVKMNNKWVLPSEITTHFEPNPSKELFCFVLTPRLSAMVDGVECVTWGHGLQEEIVRHPYYGTQNIVDDLMK